jgi:Fe2+ transport system protein FeoA
VTLADAKVGERVMVDDVGVTGQAAELIRLGLSVGSVVTVLHKASRGPVVVQTGYSEIAVGRTLARRISVHRAL